jgi:hypothetical protein
MYNYEVHNNFPITTKFGNIVYFATLVLFLLAVFMPFTSVCDASCLADWNIRKYGTSCRRFCPDNEINFCTLYYPVLQIYQGIYLPNFVYISTSLHGL